MNSPVSNSVHDMFSLSKLPLFAVLGLMVSLVQTVVAAPAPADTFSSAFQRADASGMIRVIVTLKDADTELKAIRENAQVGEANPIMRAGNMMSALEGKAKRRGAIARHQSKALKNLQSSSFRVGREFKNLPFVSMQVSRSALDALLSDPTVSVEVEKKFKPLLSSSVPLILGKPAVGEIDGYDPADENNSLRGSDWTVAILDTGIQKANPFIYDGVNNASRVVSEACYSQFGSHPNIGNPVTTCLDGAAKVSTDTDSGEPCDSSIPEFSDCNHGTLVAGVVAGNGDGTGNGNEINYDGVATGASLMSVKIFSYGEQGDARIVAYESDVIAGLDRVLTVHQEQQQPTNIQISSVLLAFGQEDPGGACSPASKSAFETAVEQLWAANIATIAASGNVASSSDLDFPACLSSVISVGASNVDDERWVVDATEGSNEGAGLTLYAPGVNITTPGIGGIVPAPPPTGTSFAAAHVAGAWAVIKKEYPAATVGEVKAKLTSTAAPVTDPTNGDAVTQAGRIQLDLALYPIGLTIVTKIVSAYGGAATVSDFNISVSPNIIFDWPNPQSTTGDSKLVTNVANTYTLAEDSLLGYENGAWSCIDGAGDPVQVSNDGAYDGADVDLIDGEVVICEITNTQIETSSFFIIPIPGGRSVIFGL